MGTEMNVEADRAALARPRDYLAWWTSIETDVRKSMLVFAHREPERLHALVRLAYEAGQQSMQAAARRAAQPADVGAGELPPIEFDVEMQRTYIPLPGGWEIQTKGKGSTFRIAHVASQQRWQVLDDRLHEPLEALARDMRNAIAAPPLSSEPQAGKGESACGS